MIPKLTTKQMVELLGGAKAVAKKLNISVQAVGQWGEDIPASKLMMLAALIEKESHGLLTRKDLFPNCWHWIWPEQIGRAHV